MKFPKNARKVTREPPRTSGSRAAVEVRRRVCFRRPVSMPNVESEPPRVWLVLGEKAGDNAQLRVVCDALGWPVEERRIAMRERWVRGKPRMRASLHHVDL